MQLKDAVGRYGEKIAARLLADTGHRVIETNWRCRQGEIDIVAAQGSTLIICEVKTRSSVAFGQPAEAVDRAKRLRLRQLATQWLIDHPGPWDSVRFDVIAVLRPARGPAQVRHLPGAF
ncbi:MAG: YraN family protein [Jatrophihabitans sp.]